MKYTSMLPTLRLRCGLDENDTSRDEELKLLSPVDVVRECTAWEIGDPFWADLIAEWMCEVGAKPEDFNR